MPEDALVNTSAVDWPDVDSACFTVRRMQTKLHRWAGEDPGRRFGDLYNLVYDPAFLVVAWERVSTNKGAKTPGVDKATAARIETWIGVEAFLSQIRDSLKSGEFRPVEVRQVMIPKGNREIPQTRYSHYRRPRGPGQPETGARTHFRGGFQAVLIWFPPEPAGAGRDRRDPPSASGPTITEWVLEADIKACFDEISHTALMGRLRVRIKDKRVCALVKAFLKSGVFTELGDREETLTGTPQGGIITPPTQMAISASRLRWVTGGWSGAGERRGAGRCRRGRWSRLRAGSCPGRSGPRSWRASWTASSWARGTGGSRVAGRAGHLDGADDRVVDRAGAGGGAGAVSGTMADRVLLPATGHYL